MVNGTLPGSIVLGLFSLIVLMYSSERTVEKIRSLCAHYGVSNTFAGLTIFSIITSLPEIIAHFIASIEILTGGLDYKIASATVLGANIGSDVVQQTFVLGLVVLLMGGITFKKDFLITAYLPMIGTTLMCIMLGFDGTFSRFDGLLLFGTFILYLIFLYERNHHYKIPKSQLVKLEHVGKAVGLTIVFMAVMLVSAHFLLLTSQYIVGATGLSGSLIGVLVIGVASASPEMFTAISGIRQGALGISLGTLIGSNITNPLVAIGGGALLSTYWVPKPLIYWDLAMETITAALLLLYLLRTKGKLGRTGAFYLIGLYILYLIIRVVFFSVDSSLI